MVELLSGSILSIATGAIFYVIKRIDYLDSRIDSLERTIDRLIAVIPSKGEISKSHYTSDDEGWYSENSGINL